MSDLKIMCIIILVIITFVTFFGLLITSEKWYLQLLGITLIIGPLLYGAIFG